MKRLLRRPSPALLLSTVAVFLAAGGTAYALSITGADVVNGSLTGSDIRNRSLTQSDLHGRSLKGTLMQTDSVGNNAVKEEVLDASKLAEAQVLRDDKSPAWSGQKSWLSFRRWMPAESEILRSALFAPSPPVIPTMLPSLSCWRANWKRPGIPGRPRPMPTWRARLGPDDVAEQVGYLKKAARLDSGNPGFHASLGEALLRSGDVSGAVTELRAAIADLALDHDAHLWLAKAVDLLALQSPHRLRHCR